MFFGSVESRSPIFLKTWISLPSKADRDEPSQEITSYSDTKLSILSNTVLQNALTAAKLPLMPLRR
jgi:hypothetical protein